VHSYEVLCINRQVAGHFENQIEKQFPLHGSQRGR